MAKLGLFTLIPLIAVVLYLINQPNERTVHTSEVELSSSEIHSLKKLGLSNKKPIQIIVNSEGGKFEQIIYGRFLHITDLHPDPFYKVGSNPEESCHSNDEPGEAGPAGKYGDAVLGCDSPLELVNDTIAWVAENLRDKIDFVVWTGDNVRHDNDRRYPRFEQAIFDLNEQISDLFYETFRNRNDSDPRKMDVELVPSLGNNDVYPHNLFSPGPTLQTREMFRIWRNFVPQPQLHTFNKGAYFFQEVIPNHLAVLSLNTLYLFQSNPLVDNCDSRKQPGYQLFEWLGYVLKEMRARNMKVWILGHVPPNGKNYDESCLRKYIVWSHEYRDVIIGGLFGHMNMDHFIPLDSTAAYKSIHDSVGSKEFATLDLFSTFDMTDEDSEELDRIMAFGDDEIRIQGGTPRNKVQYMESLRETIYSTIKGTKKSGKHSERYSIAHVTASVIPTFNPGLRVWEYNITGLAEQAAFNAKYKFTPWDDFFTALEKITLRNVEDDDVTIMKKDKTLPPKMPKHLPLGPAYIQQTFTPERYVQYFADLKLINEGTKKFAYEYEYATDDSLYGLKDLTVDEWLKFGRKLGKPVKGGIEKAKNSKVKNKKGEDRKKGKKGKKGKKEKDYSNLELIWKNYIRNTFVASDYENMGYG